MQRADIWTVFTLAVCSVSVCVLLDCKIQLLSQFPLLFGILNQCDNLIFRHFLFSPSAYSSAVLPASRLTLPLRLSFPVLLPSLSPSLPVRIVVCVYLHASTSPHSLRLFLSFIFLICLWLKISPFPFFRPVLR